MIDLTTYSDADLEVLRVQVANEIHHRNVLRSAEDRSRELSAAYHQAADRGTPEGETPAWRQPTGAHDSYLKGHIRSHNGKIWESLRDGNTDEPGTGSWREKVAPGSPPALWVQPLGSHDAYSEGDYVTWPETNTHVWLNTHPGEYTNVWEPGEFAAWVDKGPVEDWEPEESP